MPPPSHHHKQSTTGQTGVLRIQRKIQLSRVLRWRTMKTLGFIFSFSLLTKPSSSRKKVNIFNETRSSSEFFLDSRSSSLSWSVGLPKCPAIPVDPSHYYKNNNMNWNYDCDISYFTKNCGKAITVS